jgi:hypothetical protein
MSWFKPNQEFLSKPFGDEIAAVRDRRGNRRRKRLEQTAPSRHLGLHHEADRRLEAQKFAGN